MKNIIFISSPAAGKGTQAEKLEKKYNLAHISTGDLLRNEVKSVSEMGKMLDKIMKEGKLVSDDVVTTLLKNKLNTHECDNGFILDGYPRNINQAKTLDKILDEINKKINYVINLDVDYDTAMKRSCGRLQCKNCGKIYNKYSENLKPSIDGKCDKCGEVIYQRSDDNEESFKIRFNTYQESTKPLIEYYNNKGILFKVDSSKTVEEVFSTIENIIGK